jgi:hypothetical protein
MLFIKPLKRKFQEVLNKDCVLCIELLVKVGSPFMISVFLFSKIIEVVLQFTNF